jgi:hypothetical protein
MKRLFKYRVKFETEVQVDGWSDWRDYEVEDAKETITVLATNIANAKKVAIAQAHGYWVPACWGPGYYSPWKQYNIKKISRVKKEPK